MKISQSNGNRVASVIAFFLGLIFIKAGMEKLVGIPDIIGPHYLIEKLEEYQLGLYGKFIAYAQMVIGFLLITNRFRTLGAVMLMPMLLNILMVTISLQWQGTPYVVGLFVALNGVLLVLDFHKLKFLISDGAHPELVALKVKRKHLKLDMYYLILFLVMLTGTFFGWTKTGKTVTNTSFLCIILSMIGHRLFLWNKKRKNQNMHP